MIRHTLTHFILAASLILPAAGQSNKMLVDNSASPHAKLRSVDFDSVRWTDGFWADRFGAIRDTTLPLLYDLAAEPERGAIQNLEIAAGLKQGGYTGNNWMDAWAFKWLESAAAVYSVTKDEELGRQMDELISVIAKAQQPDGYLATQNIVRNRPRFQQPGHHEVYTMGHLLTAGAIHHRLTGKDSLLQVARNTADFLAGQFADENPKMAHFPRNPSVIMGAADLYRVTRDPRHLQLANDVINTRGAFEGGSDLNQDRVPLREEVEVYGHAVFYTYLFAGAADAYMETGDPALLSALSRLWDDLVEHKLYITGGASAYYEGSSFRRKKGWGSDMLHEAVGPSYYLPKWSYNETCGQVGVFLWNWRMLAITGDARYGELMEREMYNGFLPGIGVAGDSFLYTNPMRWLGEEQVLLTNDSRVRHLPGKNEGTCCPTNVMRALAQMQGYFYSTSGNDLWIHHYGGNNFANGNYLLTQETNYPWEGSIKISVRKAPAGGTVHLRIPEWTTGASVRVNGENLNLKGSGYVAVKRPWSGDDVITMEFPMNVRLMRGHRKVDATHGQIAVMRGPLVYCLESLDLPSGVDISEIILPRDIELEPKMEPGFLGGVVTLNGQALRLPQDNSHLYNELNPAEPTPIDIKLIPYYSWNNRGISKMLAWLPVGW